MRRKTIIFRLAAIFIIFQFVLLLGGRFFNPAITLTQLDGIWTYGKMSREYIPYEEMGNNIKKAVIASEDQLFIYHNGFDTKAIEKAIAHNEKGKTIRGGSTISQQTAKNIFLWQGRSWLRKGLEVAYTLSIERLWNKKIILERYLNVIEMGQGVFGIEAAAQHYYRKSAKDLNKSEAAWIACILPNPKVYDPKNPSKYLMRKHRWIMNQMNNIQIP